MFLRLLTPRIVVLCLDGLIDQGDLSPELRKTIRSITRLEEVGGVSYRKRRDVDDWLSLNPLGFELPNIVCAPGTWSLPPIAEALNARGRASWEAVAICADALEVAQAHTVGAGAILVTDREEGPVPHREPFTTGPDFVFHAGEDASSIFASTGLYAGHVGEVLAAEGLVPRLVGSGSVRASTFHFENPEAPDAPVHVFGRYFSTADPRYPLHPLSLRLINAKKYPERQANLVARILDFWMRVYKPGPVMIGCIPPRPGVAPNVVARAIPIVKAKDVTPNPDLMACVRDYPKQKDAGAPELRRENVRGAFRAQASVKGRKVVVVDDIATSFSTLNEARAVLLDAGAAEVMLVAIGFHPKRLDEGPSATCPNCRTCKKRMVPRFRKNDGVPFFACSDFEKFKVGEKHPVINFPEAFENAVRTV